MKHASRLRRLVVTSAMASAVALTLGIGTAAAQQGPGVTDKTIKIGTWVPLTGPIAAYGVPQRAGIEAYLKLVNDRGGVKGRKFELVVEDNAYNPQRTLAAARKLVSRDEVLAIVVPNGTAQSAATFDYLLNEAKVPLLNPYAGAPDWYSPPRANLYGGLVPYEFQAKSLGRWAAKDGAKNFVVVHSALAQFEGVAKEVLPGARGINASAQVELYPVKFDTTDYGPIAVDIARKKPDTIVFILAQGEVVRAAKELRQQGVKARLYTYSPNVSNSLLDLGGPAVDGMRSASFTQPVTLETPAMREFRDALAKYSPGEKPDYVALMAYGMTKIVVEAFNRIEGPINRQSLTRALESIKNYDSGIIPSVTYGPDRHLGASTVQRVEVQNGAWVTVGAPIDTLKDW
jgi:branched-chain amino acid transport system substrate-binding protein